MKKAHILSMGAALLLSLAGCQGPRHITNDPTILLNYQTDPSQETLDALSKSYLNTINQNRKTGQVMPGLYSDYAVTLYLMGKPEAAASWFNKEVATFPYTAAYVRQLREDLGVRLGDASRAQAQRLTIDDIESMDQITELRPTENRQPSRLTRETMREAEAKSREAVRGLDKPLTRDEQKALKNADKENKRQQKAAQTGHFAAPEQASEVAARKTKAEAVMANTKAQKDTAKRGLFGWKKKKRSEAADSAKAQPAKEKRKGLSLFGKKKKAHIEKGQAMDDTAPAAKQERMAKKRQDKAAARAQRKAKREAEETQKKAGREKAKAEKARKKGLNKRQQEEERDFNDAFGK